MGWGICSKEQMSSVERKHRGNIPSGFKQKGKNFNETSWSKIL